MNPLRRFWLIVRKAGIATYEVGLIDIAKGAAFSALLSFFPVLTTLATILVQANAERVSQSIAKFLFEVVPPGTEDVVQTPSPFAATVQLISSLAPPCSPSGAPQMSLSV